MIQMLAGTLEGVANVTQCEVSKLEWMEFYAMLHNNCIPENFIDIVTEWEKIVSGWYPEINKAKIDYACEVENV